MEILINCGFFLNYIDPRWLKKVTSAFQPYCCDGDACQVAHVQTTETKPGSRETPSYSECYHSAHTACTLTRLAHYQANIWAQDSCRTHYAGSCRTRMARGWWWWNVHSHRVRRSTSIRGSCGTCEMQLRCEQV